MTYKSMARVVILAAAATCGTAVMAPAIASAETAVSAKAWSGKRTFTTGYHPQCSGWYKSQVPYKTGRYIKTGAQIHCNSGGWGRRINTRLDLQQYRGLGVWRNKATAKHTDNNASHAYTRTLVASWKCSGGSQLYRPTGKVQAYSVLRGSQTATLQRSVDQRRIRC